CLPCGSGAGMDARLDLETTRWLLWDKNPLTLELVKQLIVEDNTEELQKCFGAQMEFGTAGLRAAMRAGISRMNDLTIIQTTQGFCRYLEKQFSDLKQRGVVISFDARAHPSSGGSSKRFARLAATTFISRGIPVHLFNDVTPTPFVPYAVSHLKLCAGIMVTASHNPKQDNGYKVYWDNGAQIISPHNKGISQAIEENLEPWPQAWNDSFVDGSSLLHNPSASVSKDYFEDLTKYCFHRSVNRESQVKFVHTSVHGVGHDFVQSAFKAFDLVPPEVVAEQKDPDPEFPVVKYPNPEEGKGVSTLSFALADKTKAKIVLANDPDANRLAQNRGEWRITVSSKILRAIALKEGFHFEETLTGFKWMGNRAKQLIDQGKTVLFAFEEAIGYMCCPFFLDKDGVSAAVIRAELASFLASKNLSLSQQLQAIYVEDLTTGYDDTVLPTSKSSQMITFTFANGGAATMRTSRTEPKIKYYAELCVPPGNSDPEQLKKELNELVNAIEVHFFQPQKYKLQPKAE
uniref:Phosphoglucomutase 2 n=1 Tax=Propithecus coquereli TaxID=379532 RepID=A0A2K6GAR1_PROCO